MKRSISLILSALMSLTFLLASCSETETDRYLTDPIPEGRPAPVEPDDAVIEDAEYTCTLSIFIEAPSDSLKSEKRELVPDGGYLLEASEVTFYGGESVFNLLRRVCRQNGIHLEFSMTPIYNSAYIEGMGNLYEFDAGALSGWVYSVNGWEPNYGSSRYALKPGDKVEWRFVRERGESQRDR